MWPYGAIYFHMQVQIFYFLIVCIVYVDFLFTILFILFHKFTTYFNLF